MAQVVPIETDEGHSDAGGVEEEFFEDDDAYYYEDDEYYSDGESVAETKKRKHWIQRDFEKFRAKLSYDYIKKSLEWCLVDARLNLSFTFEDLTMIMTVYVLFANDIMVLCAPKSMDSAATVVSSICFFTFIYELLANTWAKSTFVSFYPLETHGYFNSFFFWLDIISLLSLILDIHWIAAPLGVGNLSSTIASNNPALTKAGRVVRLVRLVRLIRLFKVWSERRRREQEMEELRELARIKNVNVELIMRQRELDVKKGSKLGSRLADRTTRKIIIVILTMLIVLPLLTPNAVNNAPEFGTALMHKFNVYSSTDSSNVAKANVFDLVTNSGIDFLSRYHRSKYLLSLKFNNNAALKFGDEIKHLRAASIIEETELSVISSVQYKTRAVFDNNFIFGENSLYSIILTVVVAGLLVMGSYVITTDAERLVLDPIERMVNLVEAVAKDPLQPMQFAPAQGVGQYETMLLESTIEKITGLLRVGFGEAGAAIISTNLQNTKGSQSAVNALLPGVRVYALFGFCDVHSFDDINWKLEADILTFVNTVADIVHTNIANWGGRTNKNLGNAFVIVWRIGDEHSIAEEQAQGIAKRYSSTVRDVQKNNDNEDGGEPAKRIYAVDLARVLGTDDLADKALVGYLKIIVEINRRREILDYRKDPRLNIKGQNKFKVRMGFGLHAGWAIEGAVGSVQKIDATYLSPHVNMSARLETSSRQYGVPLLLSSSFYDLMSPYGKQYLRKLDVVTVKGSEVPIGIYTYDCIQNQTFAKVGGTGGTKASEKAPGMEKPAEKPGAMFSEKDDAGLNKSGDGGIELGTPGPPATPGMQSPGLGSPVATRNSLLDQLKQPMAPPANPVFKTIQDHSSDVFAMDTDLIMLRSHITEKFTNDFKEGINLYLEGDWMKAKSFFEACDEYMKGVPGMLGDGPSRTLLSYMSNTEYVAPESWKGFRPLTSK